MNANWYSITNLKSLVFMDVSSNGVSVDAQTFLASFNGESIKLVNPDLGTQYLIISNGTPWMVTSNSIKEVTLQGNTFYLRQYEPTANISNLNIWSSLVIQNSSGIDDSNYSVTQRQLTNGTIARLVTSSLSVGGHEFSTDEIFNFYYTNSVSGANPVTNTVKTVSANSVSVNEWNYLVSKSGYVKTGKLVFSAVANASVTRLAGTGVTETVYASETGLGAFKASVIATNNIIRLVLTGDGKWTFYGLSREVAQ